MENSASTIEKVALRYGLYTAGGLTVYFLLMVLVGLVHVVELRGLNLFIMLAGLWFALKHYQESSSSHLTYFEGIALGTLTASVAVIPFAILLLFYLKADTGLMQMLMEQEKLGQYLNPFLLAFIISFEGVISGVIASFVLMQYLKKKYIGATS